MWTGLLDLLFPPRCAGCGRRGAHFCGYCTAGLRRIRPPFCHRCGDPIGVSGPCAGCRRAPPAFALARSVAAYEGGLRQAIHALKYRRQRHLADPLGALAAHSAPPEVIAGVCVVVPVPLHPRRLAERGFNQAQLLAAVVARHIGVPLLPGALRRVQQEASQTALGVADRRRNTLRAFAPGQGRLSGTVLLIDDVFSTGATAAACAEALMAAGAERVVALTLARALLREGTANAGRFERVE